MSDVIDWSKAPEGWDVFIAGQFHAGFYKDSGDRYVREGGYYRLKDDEAHYTVFRRPWSGEGLPPVGTVCGHVVSGDKDYPFLEWASGDKLEVIAHREVCGVMLPIVFNLRHNTATAIQPHLLKPIRTKEQIAADERKAAINEMLTGTPWPGSDISRRVCEHIYDAGYRKQ
jgi:hypothetical protein